MTRRILTQRMARWALMGAPPTMDDLMIVARAQQVTNDYHTLKDMDFDDGAAYCIALMVGGVLAGRMGGPFDGGAG